MKKVFSFLRSMRFGMILLALVIACALAGSLIPQGEESMAYVRLYGAESAKWVLRLGLQDIFHGWFFLTLEALLCGNLLLCSLIRFSRIRKIFPEMKERARILPPDHPLNPGEAARVREALDKLRFRQKTKTAAPRAAAGLEPGSTSRGQGEIFFRNGAGVWGSFLTHLSILIILLFGSLTLMTPEIEDRTVLPGEALNLEGGISIECLAFHIENEQGQLDYASLLRVSDAAGNAKEQEIRVNEPLRFGNIKIYQQTYGTAGRVLIRNSDKGAEETLYLTEPAFLSIDSRNGVYFQALYPGFIREEDGSYTLITSTSMGYADPVYSIQSISEGEAASVLVFPGETLTMGAVSFTFLSPTEYPGLRIKKLSSLLFAGLYFGFGLMIAALYLCFFRAPVCVCVTEEGYRIVSLREQPGLELTLREAVESRPDKKIQEEDKL